MQTQTEILGSPMTSEHMVRLVGLFYFFALLDEAKAKKASLFVVSQLQRIRQDKSIPDREWIPLLIKKTEAHFRKIKKKEKGRPQGVLTFEAGFQIPGKADFGFWQQFHRDVRDDELVVLIWSQILKISDEDIAEGLDVTTGTVRHRIARGLRLFGSIIKAGG